MTINVFCEYLISETERIRRAAYSAIRLIVSYGLKTSLFDKEKKEPCITDILNLDALTISEEVKNIRTEKLSTHKFSNTDKTII